MAETILGRKLCGWRVRRCRPTGGCTRRSASHVIRCHRPCSPSPRTRSRCAHSTYYLPSHPSSDTPNEAAARAGGGKTPVGGPRATAASNNNNVAVQALTAQVAEMSLGVEALEKERDFYFEKVRVALDPSVDCVFDPLWCHPRAAPRHRDPGAAADGGARGGGSGRRDVARDSEDPV
jgi:hypothetical protein